MHTSAFSDRNAPFRPSDVLIPELKGQEQFVIWANAVNRKSEAWKLGMKKAIEYVSKDSVFTDKTSWSLMPGLDHVNDDDMDRMLGLVIEESMKEGTTTFALFDTH